MDTVWISAGDFSDHIEKWNKYETYSIYEVTYVTKNNHTHRLGRDAWFSKEEAIQSRLKDIDYEIERLHEEINSLEQFKKQLIST